LCWKIYFKTGLIDIFDVKLKMRFSHLIHS